MEQSTARRRLVKSPPELWAEVSSEDVLGRHLASFGEIRITRAEPETTVAWEGDRASGTVALEPAGWGTNVILTATPSQRAGSPAAQVRPRFLARLFRRRATKPAPSPRAPSQPAPGPEPMPPDPDPAPTLLAPEPRAATPARGSLLDRTGTTAILADVLDDLGADHHRPFSRG